MLGAIILIVTNILHPRGADFDDTAELLQEIADAGIYLGDHLGLLVGALLFTGGLIGISRSLAGAGGEVWARLGFAAAVAGAALMLVLIAVDGVALKAVAAYAEQR